VNRWMWIFIAVVCLLILLAFVGYLTGNWNEDEAEKPGYPMFSLASAESTPVELGPCMNEETREQIRTVMLEALDEALKEHVKHVFEVWLKDERGQPERARTGVRQGIRAYLGARKGALDWTPPPCPG
jgi:hypothetical protein